MREKVRKVEKKPSTFGDDAIKVFNTIADEVIVNVERMQDAITNYMERSFAEDWKMALDMIEIVSKHDGDARLFNKCNETIDDMDDYLEIYSGNNVEDTEVGIMNINKKIRDSIFKEAEACGYYGNSTSKALYAVSKEGKLQTLYDLINEIQQVQP